MLGFKKFLVGAVASLATMTGAATAQDWSPDKQLNMLVGFGAGGATDSLARVVASGIEETTGWTVIVENRPGGGGVAMFTEISQAAPTGSVIGVGVNTPIQVNLVKRGDKLPFNLDSFDYLGTISKAETVLVAVSDAPYSNLDELLAHAKENGPVNIAFDGVPQKMLMELAGRKSDASFNMVSTQGGAETLKLMLGGQVDLGFTTAAFKDYITTGQIKPIAATTKDRLGYATEVKTFLEHGVGAYLDPYFYVAAPVGLPEEVKTALAKALDDALKVPETAEAIQNIAQNPPVNLGPDGTKTLLVSGIENIRTLFVQ